MTTARRLIPAMILALIPIVAVSLFVLPRGQETLITPAVPGFVNGEPIDVIFDTSVPLFPGGYESSIAAAEDATKGKTLQPADSELPGLDKTANVWLFKTDVGYRYGDDLVIQTTPFTIKTTPEAYLQNHAEHFGGTLTTIGGYPALVRPAYSFEASERQVTEHTRVVVPDEAVDTTVIEMIVGDTEVTLFGRELSEADVVKVAGSLS